MDVTEMVVDWLKSEDRFFRPDRWGGTGQRVLVPTEPDKASFNRAVQAAFSRWEGSECDDLCMFEDVWTEAKAREEKRVSDEFTKTPYRRPSTVVHFEEYLGHCWREYCRSDSGYAWPLISVVQSAGFGKSRLMFELAKRTKDTQGGDALVRVLYTSLRGATDTTGYPRPTTKLRDYFFPVGDNDVAFVDRIVRLFDYASSQWDSVGNQWIDLFTDVATDVAVQAQLEAFALGTPSSECKEKSATYESRRVVVLIIDDVHALFTNEPPTKLAWQQCLGLLLATACQKIQNKRGAFAGVLTVAVGSGDLFNQVHVGESNHGIAGSALLPPPFVLTHTLNAMVDSVALAPQADSANVLKFFRSQVLAGLTAEDSFLHTVGRPLWTSFSRRLGIDGVTELAAKKLLCGRSPGDPESFTAATMRGVAAMLCRLGVRPLSSSPFSARAVDELMAVLMYVRIPKHQVVSSYPSEPMLAFGAARVWYGASSEDDHFAMLHRHLLPQLQELIAEEALDTGDIGVLVARIVLLLAMDTMGALATNTAAARCYTGEFCDAWTFLRAFGASTTTVEDFQRRDVSSSCCADLDELKKKWKDWLVGFSHFVQLTQEPDDKTLWMLLACRAAGVRPRNSWGADLIIPMFMGEQISMILVQVGNQSGRNWWYDICSWTVTQPEGNFTRDPFHELSGRDVVRLRLDLTSSQPSRHFYLRDLALRNATITTSPSFVLCFQGLATMDISVDMNPEKPVILLSEQVVVCLKELLQQWWRPGKLIEAGLVTQANHVGIDPRVIGGMAADERLWPSVTYDANRADTQQEGVIANAGTTTADTEEKEEVGQARKAQGDQCAQKKPRRK